MALCVSVQKGISVTTVRLRETNVPVHPVSTESALLVHCYKHIILYVSLAQCRLMCIQSFCLHAILVLATPGLARVTKPCTFRAILITDWESVRLSSSTMRN